MKIRKGQQEIVGFVLIVVLVVVALLIFMVISSKKTSENLTSSEADNILNTLLSYTTSCAIVFEPQYDSMEDLIKSCYNNEKCSNLDKMACDYLNETILNISEKMIKTEASISAFQLNIFQNNSEQISQLIKPVHSGNCTGSVAGSIRRISNSQEDIFVKLLICKAS